MMRLTLLSWTIWHGMPLYPGSPSVSFAPGRQIAAGDSCNTATLTMSTHTGTHIDAPRHFFESGRTVTDYGPDQLLFSRPFILNCAKQAGEPIKPQDLEGHPHWESADLLLIRTGFHRRCIEDSLYCSNPPYITPAAAEKIKASPQLKAVGIDTISVASPAHREAGRATHRILLSDELSRPALLIIEDMNLSADLNGLSRVVVAPLMVQGMDGAPATVFGVLND